MSSTSETGHAKNLANFKTLISFCKGYGGKYNPSKDALKAANLDKKFASCSTALAQLKTAETSFKTATNNRVIGFKNLKSFSTQIINALDSTDAAAETVKDARSINRKIQGKRAIEKEAAQQTPPDAMPIPPDKTISVSQQSYDSLVDNFEKLVKFVVADAAYLPNEPELTAESLQTNLAKLYNLNDEVVNKYTDLSNKRISRNEEIYNPLTGLVQTAQDVKKYILSVFKANSDGYRQVSSIQFRKR